MEKHIDIIGLALAILAGMLHSMCNFHNNIKLECEYYDNTAKYRVRQRGCSLTHSARTPPAVHPGIMITRKNNFFK